MIDKIILLALREGVTDFTVDRPASPAPRVGYLLATSGIEPNHTVHETVVQTFTLYRFKSLSLP